MTMMHAEWMALKDKFETLFGDGLPDSKLHAQSYFESFEDPPADNYLEADPLSLGMSLAEENIEKARRSEPIHRLGLHLDISLTIEQNGGLHPPCQVLSKNFARQLRYWQMFGSWPK